jgi:hypothetical protein
MAAGVVSVWSCVEPHILTTERYTIRSSEVPAAFSGFTMAFISDFHVGRYYRLEDLSRAVDRIASEEVDLLLLGGDYVYHREGDYRAIFRELARLRPPHGIYSVSGNHDAWDSYSAALRSLAPGSITMLDNRVYEIRRGDQYIRLAGIADMWSEQAVLDQPAYGEQDDAFAVFVSHNPDYLIEHPETFDLGIAGHTHGGQITVFGLWAPFLPMEHGDVQWKGRQDNGGGTRIVSRGLGTIGLPLRFFAPPEITLITLEAAAPTSD